MAGQVAWRFQGTIPNQERAVVLREGLALHSADHECYVAEVMTLEPLPDLKPLAVLQQQGCAQPVLTASMAVTAPPLMG